MSSNLTVRPPRIPRDKSSIFLLFYKLPFTCQMTIRILPRHQSMLNEIEYSPSIIVFSLSVNISLKVTMINRSIVDDQQILWISSWLNKISLTIAKFRSSKHKYFPSRSSKRCLSLLPIGLSLRDFNKCATQRLYYWSCQIISFFGDINICSLFNKENSLGSMINYTKVLVFKVDSIGKNFFNFYLVK